MPVHDWTRVDAGIFHAFHHSWIEEIARALNRRLLPPDYYALPEQVAVGLGPDVLTLQGSGNGDGDDRGGPRLPPTAGGVSVLTAPQAQPTAETDMEFYRRKQNMIAVRHVSGDRVVAIIEIVSPGNKAARNPLRAFVAKAAELLSKGVHLLVVDVFPPGRRDPQGIHSEIWQEIAGQEYEPPADKPLTVAAYDAGDALRAYVRNVVTCSPKTGPGGMRVSEAPRGRETNHEATHGRGGHRQAAPGRGRPGPG
ncbi:MAG TPA: DUF4058 family protein, partial [Gemmataceae bacterium]|nr:DUF4058 family protein [Gemmataceae bacterium]